MSDQMEDLAGNRFVQSVTAIGTNEESELAALRTKHAELQEAFTLRTQLRNKTLEQLEEKEREYMELRTKLEELKDELCEAQLRLLGCKRAVTLEKSRAEEAERKLKRICKCEFSSGGVLKKPCEYHNRLHAQARVEGMEEAAKVCDAMDTEQFPGNQMVFQRDCARRLSAAIRSAIEKGRG